MVNDGQWFGFLMMICIGFLILNMDLALALHSMMMNESFGHMQYNMVRLFHDGTWTMMRMFPVATWELFEWVHETISMFEDMDMDMDNSVQLLQDFELALCARVWFMSTYAWSMDELMNVHDSFVHECDHDCMIVACTGIGVVCERRFHDGPMQLFDVSKSEERVLTKFLQFENELHMLERSCMEKHFMIRVKKKKDT